MISMHQEGRTFKPASKNASVLKGPGKLICKWVRNPGFQGEMCNTSSSRQLFDEKP